MNERKQIPSVITEITYKTLIAVAAAVEVADLVRAAGARVLVVLRAPALQPPPVLPPGPLHRIARSPFAVSIKSLIDRSSWARIFCLRSHTRTIIHFAAHHSS